MKQFNATYKAASAELESPHGDTSPEGFLMSLTDLSKVFEWTVGVHLGRIKNFELILLKGHLMLEVAINNAIHTLDKHNTSKLKDLSFHRKLQILDNLRPYSSSDLKKALGHLRNLNILRNRLAHEFMFDGGAEDLGRWSEAVLVDFPGTKFCRHTFRTKIVQAFGALARLLVDPLSSEEIVFGEGSIEALRVSDLHIYKFGINH